MRIGDTPLKAICQRCEQRLEGLGCGNSPPSLLRTFGATALVLQLLALQLLALQVLALQVLACRAEARSSEDW